MALKGYPRAWVSKPNSGVTRSLEENIFRPPERTEPWGGQGGGKRALLTALPRYVGGGWFEGRSDRLLAAAGKKDVGGCLPRVLSNLGECCQGGWSTRGESKPAWWEGKNPLVEGPCLGPLSRPHHHPSACSSTQPPPHFPYSAL